MNKLPTISVVTPSKDQGRFIQTCLTSVKKQVGVSIEHLIIDDESKDNTTAVVNNYINEAKDINYKLKLHSIPNKGTFDSTAIGVEKATGDFIAVCNTSDYYFNNAWFNTAISAIFNKCKEIDCVWAMAGKVFEGKEYVVHEISSKKALPLISHQVYGLEEFKKYKFGFAEVTAIFRADVLKNLMPQKDIPHPWLDTIIDFYSKGHSSFLVNTVAALTREHHDSMTRKWGQQIEDTRFNEFYKKVASL